MLATGPWSPEQVDAHWRDDAYEPPPEVLREADAIFNRSGSVWPGDGTLA